ncbi:MBL fold metallo-hydrolase [Papillibacter cinnamivorans]|uniref:Phosphoribosyl 1,2-cyclic phosphodiesterase n=1 Tax=Papillibacter cinnamivorans DSM 12816 TaxID=1122930 RepID=A0A1W2CMY1_9FIRM|nr:MBL fold metallo-hydrolase [Papillibacter cinnamivorans]SMC86551.1 Phosphoribosyl 1,2-cyclic phosphodiesterase [Papillibacter cinnamivorans DSM 12816]
MLSVCTFASSSSGNCLLVSCGNAHILVDAGISARRIAQSLKCLGLSLADLDGILITHEHRDHIAGLETLAKHCPAPVFAGEGTAEALLGCAPSVGPRLRPFIPGSGFEFSGVCVSSFPTPHDTPVSVGYRLESGGRSAAVATDLGFVPEAVLKAVSGADVLVLEANHDVETLKYGPYPYFLKQRILGNRGHLSNDASAAAACTAAGGGTRRIILAHLSRENNTPKMALDTVTQALFRAGIRAGEDLELSVAPQFEMGPRYILD